MHKKKINHTPKNLIRRIKLIHIGELTGFENSNLLAVGRIRDGIMEMKIGFGRSRDMENSVNYMRLSHQGGKSHSKSHFHGVSLRQKQIEFKRLSCERRLVEPK